MAMNELIQEIQNQLEEDLLAYGWILQLARDSGDVVGGRAITDVAYEAVTALLSQGLAEIGDARLENDRVEFYAWPGTLDEQILQLKQTIDQFGTDPGLGEGFWLTRRASPAMVGRTTPPAG
jgi:hypothetical protein